MCWICSNGSNAPSVSGSISAVPENAYGLVEMAFVFGLVICVGVWQLLSIEKTRKRLREEEARKDDDS